MSTSESTQTTVPTPPSDDLVSVVRRSPLPAVVLELPSERFVLTNRAARVLLTGDDPGSAEDAAGADGADAADDAIAGRSLEEFLSDPPSGGLDLMRAGRLSGYETSRHLRRTGLRLQVWVRAAAVTVPVDHALALILPADDRALPMLPPVRQGEAPLVLGTTDAALHVERVSSDVEELLGVSVAQLTGRSVLTLVDTRDAPSMLLAIAEAAHTGRGVTFSARRPDDDDGEGAGQDGDDTFCQWMVVPLDPAPSVGFMMLPGSGSIYYEASPAYLEQLVRKFARTIDAATTSRATGDIDLTGRSGRALSSRELDIVGRLLAGDRVPAIAKTLFLSQSTVRNHLSAVFKKFGVSSQQELIDFLRKQDAPPTA